MNRCPHCTSQFCGLICRFYMLTRYPETEAARKLMANRNITATGCWEWTGFRNHGGYGALRVPGMGKTRNQTLMAHRVAYTEFVGPIPDGMLICHKCDNPPCFNPEHLFVGTPGDNTRDCHAKGRAARLVGSLSGRAKLTEVQVAEMFTMREQGVFVRAIAAKFDIHPAHASHILNGNRWPHIWMTRGSNGNTDKRK